MPLDYPYFSQQARDLLAGLTVGGEPITGVYLQWAPLSWVPRPTNDSATTSFNFSFEGSLPLLGSEFDWEAGYSFGKSRVLATEVDYLDGRFLLQLTLELTQIQV